MPLPSKRELFKDREISDRVKVVELREEKRRKEKKRLCEIAAEPFE